MSVKDPADASTRQARAAMFNVPDELGPKHDISQPGNTVGYGRFDDYSRPSSLPVETSEVIVTGTVTDTHPYLSADHTQVYSELSFTPDSILKDKSAALRVNQPAVILSQGGAIRFPNGVLAKSVAGGGSCPINVETRYLLFMHYYPAAKAYKVHKAWDISGPQPHELDMNGFIAHKLANADSIQETTPDSLVELVKSRITDK